MKRTLVLPWVAAAVAVASPLLLLARVSMVTTLTPSCATVRRRTCACTCLCLTELFCDTTRLLIRIECSARIAAYRVDDFEYGEFGFKDDGHADSLSPSSLSSSS